MNDLGKNIIFTFESNPEKIEYRGSIIRLPGKGEHKFIAVFFLKQ